MIYSGWEAAGPAPSPLCLQWFHFHSSNQTDVALYSKFIIPDKVCQIPVQLKKKGGILVEFFRFYSTLPSVAPQISLCRRMLGLNSVAEFIDPWLGDKVNSDNGLSYRPAVHAAWRAGMTILCRSWLHPQARDLWIRLQTCSNLGSGSQKL